jgi:hypothetical protein
MAYVDLINTTLKAYNLAPALMAYEAVGPRRYAYIVLADGPHIAVYARPESVYVRLVRLAEIGASSTITREEVYATLAPMRRRDMQAVWEQGRYRVAR